MCGLPKLVDLSALKAHGQAPWFTIYTLNFIGRNFLCRAELLNAAIPKNGRDEKLLSNRE